MSCIDFPQKENWTFTNNTTSCLSQDVAAVILWPPQALVLIMKERERKKKKKSQWVYSARAGYTNKKQISIQTHWASTRLTRPAGTVDIHSFGKQLHEQPLCLFSCVEASGVEQESPALPMWSLCRDRMNALTAGRTPLQQGALSYSIWTTQLLKTSLSSFLSY